MEMREMLYEGKAKKVYATEDPELLIVSYKDDATAFNGLKKGTIAGKGVINNKMSNALMRLLEKKGVPTAPTSQQLNKVVRFHIARRPYIEPAFNKNKQKTMGLLN